MCLFGPPVFCRYSRDGVGIPLMGSLAECMFPFLIRPFFPSVFRSVVELISVHYRCIYKQIVFFSTSCFLCSLGYGVPGVHAVHVAESVYGLDSEPRQEASVQTSAVGAVSGIHGCRCRWSRYTGTQDLSLFLPF